MGTTPPRPPAELTDDELVAEVIRRRRLRGIAVPDMAAPNRLSAREMGRHLASLELGNRASWPEVVSAHARLKAKYAPFEAHADAPRAAAARQLLSSLTIAFEALRKHFGQ